MEDNVVYIVQFWIRPDGGKQVLDWLKRTHLADMASQPGFIRASMFELEQTNDEDWPAYMMMYSLESRAALEAYFNSDAPARYAKERTELGLDNLFRAERYFGKAVAQA